MDERKLITWKKLGGGSFRMKRGGKDTIIKPGQIFKAYEDEIPQSFRNIVVPTDGTVITPKTEEKILEQPVQVANPDLKIQARGESKIWFDVVTTDGKKLNEKALTKVNAEALIAKLS